eukprot:CAMPEP_0113899700 /NCGR_PEP_ID=MMETSP0780_2-20120614/20208_1 /TAXON_ID=652834 /ORGANISM="Palpitomonas bilix" /LENGTH=73 /DNA_ID=CAMNT_0000891959 /DNA_START=72 /DNA_END=293 /DNA_ORIENTATION=- /assembly_acc=CAM_ASM_000599
MEAIAQFLGLDLPDSFFVISSGVVLLLLFLTGYVFMQIEDEKKEEKTKKKVKTEEKSVGKKEGKGKKGKSKKD